MRSLQKSKNRAIIALIGCALLWSSGGFLIKGITLQPLAISGGRSFVAMFFFLAVGGRPRLVAKPAFWGAVLAYAGTLTFFTLATGLTTAANAVLLQYMAPVFVSFFSWALYKLKPYKKDYAVLLALCAGLFLFFYESWRWPAYPTAMLGNIFGLLAGIFFALQAVFMHRSQRSGYSALSILVYGNLFCVIIASPVIFSQTPAPADLAGLLLLGLFQVGTAYLLYQYALPQVTALELILIPVIEPLLNPLWVFLIKGELPGLLSLIGGILILLAVTLWCLWRNRNRIPQI